MDKNKLIPHSWYLCKSLGKVVQFREIYTGEGKYSGKCYIEFWFRDPVDGYKHKRGGLYVDANDLEGVEK